MIQTSNLRDAKQSDSKDADNTSSDVERDRLEFEKDKTAHELKLEIKRYALERYKTRLEHRFLNKNLGVIISATISFAAILVSLSQVLVAKISKDKEIQVAYLQKQAESERLDKQRDKELAIQSAEQDRQWNLDRAKFITENKRVLFEGNPQELRRMSLIIETLFPHDMATGMFEDLTSTASSPEARRIWSNAKQRIQERLSNTSQSSADAGSLQSTTLSPSPETASRTGSIKGLVVDSLQKPISSAKVTLMMDNVQYRSTSTDSNGYFVLWALPPATYKIIVQKPPYTTLAHEVRLTTGATVVVEVMVK